MTRLIFGTGDYRYEVVQPFGVLPEGMEFGVTSHVGVDSQGRMYVTQRKDPPVLVFDPQGEYLGGWGQDILADPYGLFVTADDELFIADRATHEVLKLTLDGKVLLRIGGGAPNWGAPFNHPADVAVGPGGDIYVADGFGNSCVHVFDGEGKHLRSWGRPGTGPGEFSTPHGIWVDPQGQVLVADRENSRIQIFDAEGGIITQWRKGLYHPMDIWMDRRRHGVHIGAAPPVLRADAGRDRGVPGQSAGRGPGPVGRRQRRPVHDGELPRRGGRLPRRHQVHSPSRLTLTSEEGGGMPKLPPDLAKQLLEQAGFEPPQEWVDSTVRLYDTLDSQLSAVDESALETVEPHYIQPIRRNRSGRGK